VPRGGVRVSETSTVALKYGLTAHYLTHAQMARQQRAQARNEGRQPNAGQPESDEKRPR